VAQSDNIPAMLQSGEYVVRKEAVDKLGKNTMDMINNADRLGYMGGGLVPQGQHGHSAIDELLALNTLANQKSIDMTRDSSMMNKGGKVFKKIPEGNRGLMGLPEEVRNRMGYMKQGGMMYDYMGGGMIDEYMYGGMADKKKKMMGYQQGGEADPLQIEMRMANPDMYKGSSLGVEDKIAMAKNRVNQLTAMLKPTEIRSGNMFGREVRGMLDVLDEAKAINPEQLASDIMMLLRDRDAKRDSVKSYFEGGEAGQSSTGGYYSGMPADKAFFQRLYDEFGEFEDDDERKKFEERFKPDFSDAFSGIQQMNVGLSGQLGDAMEISRQTQSASGFSNVGAQPLVPNIYRTQAEGASDIFKSSKEQEEADALAELLRLQTSGGVKFTQT
tara:strand:- start:2171 stop:3328 length:1158 start_codon:yes stop_codon:yes gene_type:complete